MGLRIVLLCFCIVISEAGFVEDNQNIFYGHSEGFEPAPISYQYFVNYDKFSTSGHNAVDDHQTLKPSAQPKPLFKAADYAEQRAYNEEVHNAHRIALANRHNNTDAAYIEAYYEALKAEQKFESAGAKNSYTSHRLRNQFGFKTEHSHSRPRLPVKLNNNFQTHYEDVRKRKYYWTDVHDLGTSVEYNGNPDYELFANGVVHGQPQYVAEASEVKFPPSKFGSDYA